MATNGVQSPTRQQVAAALRVVAGLLGIAHGHGFADYGDVVSGVCYAKQAEKIAAGMTDVTVTEWTGDSGSPYRTHTGTLFGRTLEVTHLVES